jgi:DNA polymerase-1
VIGLDLETHSTFPDGALDPHLGVIRLVTLAVEETDADTGQVTPASFLIDAGACEDWPEVIGRILADATIVKVAHNGKFDLKFLMARGLLVANVFDTMLAAQLLDGGQHLKERGYFKLGTVVQRHLGQPLDKSQQTSNWGVPALSREQLEYAAKDATVLLPLYWRLKRELRKAKLEEMARLEMAALPALAWMEVAGAPFDAGAWAELSDKAMSDRLALEDEIKVLLGMPEINLESPKQFQKALAGLGIKIPDTREETLTSVVGQHPVVSKFLAYREVSKRASTYGIDFLKHVHPVTNRIHANYRQVGAATGRMSCSGPNLQNIPRDPGYRSCFRPAPGRVLVKADYSQIELRIAAQVAGDKRMIEAYQAGDDLHALTARTVLKSDDIEVRPEDRQAAKALNFGLIYGMGAPRLREYAANSYRVEMTEKEAERFRTQFFKLYPGLRLWHRRQRDGRITTRTVGGRRRLAVERFTLKLNTPIQGTGADGLKAALALLWETRDVCPSAIPVLCVHDEIVIECDADEAERAREWLVDCMKKGMERYLTKVPVDVEAKVISSWGETG